jgi:hypothetical protein
MRFEVKIKRCSLRKLLTRVVSRITKESLRSIWFEGLTDLMPVLAQVTIEVEGLNRGAEWRRRFCR